ncbi:MAG: hypothetical protein D6744_00415 [Planctomycetota bacterium]|nr:MAG: hypothetical protein D6744_00415 [Planctomycetota bacterium]
MNKFLRVRSAAALAVIVSLGWPALAESDENVSRLEALLEAQQARIEQLERQVAMQQSGNVDQQRIELMRQQIREVLSEREFRESLMPSMMQAGYDKGFYIKSSDENFSLKINAYAQFRWTHYNTRTENRYLNPGSRRGDRTGFDLQRLRLIFSGNMWSKDLTYHVQLRQEAPGQYNTEVHWAYINYRFADEFQIRAGVFKGASTRSQLMAEWGFQFVDRPVTDAVFGFANVLGVRFWGQLFDKKLEYFLDVVNALNSPANRTITTDPREHDNNPAILFRLVWHALGDDPKEWLFEGDVNMNESPQLDFGFSYAVNDDDGDRFTTRIPFPRNNRFRAGGFGLTSTNGLKLHQFTFDTAFKYMGFSAMGEYHIRIVDPIRGSGLPLAPWVLLTNQRDTTVQHGAYVQVGYFLPIPSLENKLEAVARVGGISTLANGHEGTWEYAAGLNYYLNGADAGHRTKLQFDVTKVSEVPISNSYSSLANVNDDALIFRVQLQVMF